MPPLTRKRASVGSDVETSQPPPKRRQPAKRAAKGSGAKRQSQDAFGYASRIFFQDSQSSIRKYRVDADGVKDQIHDAFDVFVKSIREDKETPIANIMASIRNHLPPDTDTNVTAEAASAVLTQLLTRTEEYRLLATQTTGVKRPAWMLWTQDQRHLSRLNKHAVATAASTINDIVLPNAPATASHIPPTDAVQRVAWDLYEGVRPGRDDVTWGRMARDLVACFAGLLGEECN